MRRIHRIGKRASFKLRCGELSKCLTHVIPHIRSDHAGRSRRDDRESSEGESASEAEMSGSSGVRVHLVCVLLVLFLLLLLFESKLGPVKG